MKYYIAILIFLVALSGKGQQKENSFVIQGQFKNLANTALYLTFPSSRDNPGQSTKTDASGNFIFTGSVLEPQVASIETIKRVPPCQFFLENTTFTLKGDAANLNKTEVKGGPEQAVYQKYNKMIAEVGKFALIMQKPISYNLKRKDTIGFNTYVNATNQIWKDSLENRQIEFIGQHPSSNVSLLAMTDIIAGNKPVSTIDSVMRLIEATPIARSATSAKIRKIISGRMNTGVGSRAPEFTQPDTSGRQVSISELRGKYVLLDFWASWCGPCRAENPKVLMAYRKYKDRNFTVLAISLDVDRRSWVKAIKEDKLPWMQLGDMKPANAAARLYGVLSIPRNFLIDPNGRIVAVDLHGESLEKVLSEFLEKKSK